MLTELNNVLKIPPTPREHLLIDQFKSFAISERKNMPLSKAGSFDIFLSILFAKRVKSFKLVA